MVFDPKLAGPKKEWTENRWLHADICLQRITLTYMQYSADYNRLRTNGFILTSSYDHPAGLSIISVSKIDLNHSDTWLQKSKRSCTSLRPFCGFQGYIMENIFCTIESYCCLLVYAWILRKIQINYFTVIRSQMTLFKIDRTLLQCQHIMSHHLHWSYRQHGCPPFVTGCFQLLLHAARTVCHFITLLPGFHEEAEDVFV